MNEMSDRSNVIMSELQKLNQEHTPVKKPSQLDSRLSEIRHSSRTRKKIFEDRSSASKSFSNSYIRVEDQKTPGHLTTVARPITIVGDVPRQKTYS